MISIINYQGSQMLCGLSTDDLTGMDGLSNGTMIYIMDEAKIKIYDEDGQTWHDMSPAEEETSPDEDSPSE